MEPHCTFETRHLTLTSIKHGHSKQSLVPNYLLEQKKFQSNFTVFNYTQLSNEERKFKDVNVALQQALNWTQSNNVMSTLHEHRQELVLHTKILYGGWSATTLLILAAASTIVILYFIKKKNYNQTDHDGTEFSNYLRLQKILKEGTM